LIGDFVMADIKLINLYTGEIVYCRDMKNILESGDMKLVCVYKKENPQREYRVNINAFRIQPDK